MGFLVFLLSTIFFIWMLSNLFKEIEPQAPIECKIHSWDSTGDAFVCKDCGKRITPSSPPETGNYD